MSPLCDRYDSNLGRSQRGFIDFVARPCYRPFAKYVCRTRVPEYQQAAVTHTLCVACLSRFCERTLWTELLRLNKEYWRTYTPEATSPLASAVPRSNNRRQSHDDGGVGRREERILLEALVLDVALQTRLQPAGH